MLYLVCATTFNAFMALLFKWSQQKKLSGETITLVNYIVAAGAFLVLTCRRQLFALLSAHSLSELVDGLHRCFSGDLNAPGSLLLSLLLGAFLGVLFLFTLLHQQYSIRCNGASMTTMFSSLSFIIPLLLSIFLWNEVPAPVQWLGIAGTLIAIVLASLDRGKVKFNRTLLSQLLLCSCTSLTGKIYAMYALGEYTVLFYFATFSTALLLYTISVLRRHIRAGTTLDRRPLALAGGVALGCVNALSVFLLQGALRRLPANIVYPTQGAGSMMLVAIISLAVFKEHLRRPQFIALALSAVCLVLVNLTL